MRRWTHLHSIGAGGLLTLSLVSYRIILALVLAFLFGCAVTLLVVNGRRLLHWSRDMIEVHRLDKQDKQRARLARLKQRQRGQTGLPGGY